MLSKKKYKKPVPQDNDADEPIEAVDLTAVKEADENILENISKEKQACSLCDGTGKKTVIAIHRHTKQPKVVIEPCLCYTSKVVSAEYKLLQHFGDQYLPPDQLDKRLNINFDDLGAIPNYIVNGTYDSFLFMMKSLIMRHRFTLDRPRILLSRSIDIVHDFHVPQEDGVSKHLSATSVFDLAVIIFGSMEVNKAVSPCMIQLVTTRLDERKPTWIYFTDVLTPKSQEYSQEITVLIEKYYHRITVETNMELKKGRQSESKRLAAQF